MLEKDVKIVDKLIGGVGMSFQLDSWECIKKVLAELSNSSDNNAMPKLPDIKEIMNHIDKNHVRWNNLLGENHPVWAVSVIMAYEFIAGKIGNS